MPTTRSQDHTDRLADTTVVSGTIFTRPYRWDQGFTQLPATNHMFAGHSLTSPSSASNQEPTIKKRPKADARSRVHAYLQSTVVS
jgi:hypothetical protein